MKRRRTSSRTSHRHEHRFARALSLSRLIFQPVAAGAVDLGLTSNLRCASLIRAASMRGDGVGVAAVSSTQPRFWRWGQETPPTGVSLFRVFNRPFRDGHHIGPRLSRTTLSPFVTGLVEGGSSWETI